MLSRRSAPPEAPRAQPSFIVRSRKTSFAGRSRRANGCASMCCASVTMPAPVRLREALNRLSAEGFVDQKDQRGFVVADINERSLDELIFTRCCSNEIMLPTVLERGDTAWEERVVLAHYHLSKTPPFTSDGRVNGDYLIRHREFHMSILAPCGSRWLLELSEKLFDWTQCYQNLALRSDVVGSRDVASEHNELVKAILARDIAKSISLLNAHVRTTGQFARAAGEKASVEVT